MPDFRRLFAPARLRTPRRRFRGPAHSLGSDLVTGLPSEATVWAVYAHHGLRPDLPFLAGYAQHLGIDPARVTISHLLRFVRCNAFGVAEPLVGYLSGQRDDGAPRFSEETQRVYLQHLKRFARLVCEARDALFGRAAAAWGELSARLAGIETPRLIYRRAWALWDARCRERSVDPFAPGDDPAKALKDFNEWLAQWGYDPETYRRYGWVIHRHLALLGVMLPPRLPLGPYESQVAEVVELIDHDYMGSLEPRTMDASRQHAGMFARFLLLRHLKARRPKP